MRKVVGILISLGDFGGYMEKQENVLVTVPYQYVFKDNLILNTKNDIILNSMKLYTLKGGCIVKNINFDICVSGDKMVLRPLEKSNEYVLFCQRVMNTSVIKIKATEYFSKTEKDGSFTFYMENDKV